jgi:hypothetical protein
MSLPPFSLARIAGTVVLLSGFGTAAAPFTPPAAHMPRVYLVGGAVLPMPGGVAPVLGRTSKAAANPGRPDHRARS